MTGYKLKIMLSGAVLLLLASCADKGGKADRKSGDDISVVVMSVAESDNKGVKNYVGTAEAGKSAVLESRYPGTVLKINVREGDIVDKGDVLAEISSQAVISAAEMARATLRQAEDGYARAEQVYGTGGMAEVKMVEIRTQLAKARSSAAAAEKALEDCRVKAPFSGVVDKVFVSEGVDVNSMSGLVRLLDISSMEIKFPVPEAELPKIREDDTVTVEIPALGISDMDGVIVSKGMVASPLSHTYDCRLVTVDGASGLMPGMIVKVYVDSGKGTGVVVPASVIRSDAEGKYVWTVRDDKVEKRYVTVGGFSGRGVIVGSGLSDGDLVIVEGVQKVCSGMKVKTVMQTL